MASPTVTYTSNFYLERFGYQPPTLTTKVDHETDVIVVIPCHNEAYLEQTLEALLQCDHQGITEVIVVVNASENDDEAIIAQNLLTHREAEEWTVFNHNESLRIFFLVENELPKKHAGVGLARKIGMDEAVARFHSIDKDGIIVCFDADALCDKNYLQEIRSHFQQYPKVPGCSIYFEHPLEGEEHDANVYAGIANYELFLRYYNQGMRYAKLPYVYHTVGSSMAVRSSAYQKQGGMNRRKAGEDFYFLHKIIALGNYTELNTTRVIPSPRPSDRVPFGTGRAIGEWLTNEKGIYETYDPQIFEDVKVLSESVNEIYDGVIPAFSDVLVAFLKTQEFDKALEEIKKNSTTFESFYQRFFRWFDAFKVLKLVHFARDHYYPNIPITSAAAQLLEKMKYGETVVNDPKSLLLTYREIERS
jgi:glycosyltransferase involved in cell wall biosynthesis